MLKREKVEEALASLRDEAWLDSSHERLTGLRADVRELVACAINPRRQRLLLKRSPSALPESIRSEGLSTYQVQAAGGAAVAAMSEPERRSLISRLVPRHERVIEAAWASMERCPIETWDEVRPFRHPRGDGAGQVRAAWLCAALRELGPMKGSMPELAAWAEHLDDGIGTWDWILVGAIDAGGPDGEAVLRTLMSCARGEHPDSGTSEVAITALLTCGRPEAWECIERLLLAAQRQEGLRQAILERVHAAHPEAFRRMCRLILEHDLCRFSSVVRAADVWFGLLWDSASPKVVEEAIGSALRYLDRPEDRRVAVTKGKPAEAYFAMWAAAFEDVETMLPLAELAQRNRNPVTRFAAAHLAAKVGVEALTPLLLRALDDADLRVAARAVDHFARGWLDEQDATAADLDRARAVFEALERLLGRIKGRSAKLPAALWPWTKRELRAEKVGAAMAQTLTNETAPRLIPHLARLDAMHRAELAKRLGGLYRPMHWGLIRPDAGSTPAPIPEASRRALLGLALDPSPNVAVSALASLLNRPILDDELDVLASLLGRKNAEVRTEALRRAGQLSDDRLLAFAQRLLSGSSGAQRIAGLELLRMMAESNRSADRARAAAAAWVSSRTLSKAENGAVGAVLRIGAERPRREDAFGLLNPANLARPTAARPLPVLCMSPAAWEVLADMARLVIANRSLEVRREEGAEPKEPCLLGSLAPWGLVMPQAGRTIEEEWTRCPIAQILRPWLDGRSPATRDDDGLEMLRALMGRERFRARIREWTYVPDWPRPILAAARKEGLDLAAVSDDSLDYVLRWAMRLDGDRGYADALLDSVEGSLAVGTFGTWEFYDDEDEEGKGADDVLHGVLCPDGRDYLCGLEDLQLQGLTARLPEHSVRIWRLALAGREAATRRWAEMDAKARERFYSGCGAVLAIDPSGDVVLEALEQGALSEDDALDLATHPYWSGPEGNVGWLTETSELEAQGFDADAPPMVRARNAWRRRARQHPTFRAVADRLRSRIIDLELARGDAPTDASPMAHSIVHAGGAEVCIRCLAGLGTRAFKRGPGWTDVSRQATLTHLVSATLPGPDDTPERFASLARDAGLPEETLVALGVFAPQWVRHVEHSLGQGWAGFEDAVWWIHAHTKDSEYRVNSMLRDRWQAAIAERTPLTLEDLRDGAVDVAWFNRVRASLGADRWDRVYEAARFACGGLGHKRAQLFADAMTGAVKERELLARVKSKRHQDSIRALGLAPLKKGTDGRAQVLRRYKVMQEIRRTSRRHGGSMLQASEKRAVEIGMENLARTGGYPDPLRLQWAMERLEIADLANGPVVVKAGDTSVSLAIDDDGAPELTAQRKGRTLAAVPAAARKNKSVAELAARAAELRRSRSRMRQALEQAMCRGDEFTAADLADLLGHPVLRPMLQRLVFVRLDGDGNGAAGPAGYPDRNGKVLRDHGGGLDPLRSSDRLRLAHPHDLLKRRDWHQWQRECFAAERVQPFKQVFRELYVPTATEGGASVESTRYEGHQVHPRQALALLGSRQWVTRADEGVQRTFYKERLTARLQFLEAFYTPAEVEGLTLHAVHFTRAGAWDPIRLSEVPPRVFSETMRDLDLVVSVAHRGGVDPEASQGTVEMRAALLAETCRLLGLTNVRIEERRALIAGTRGDYSVHLGSAGVHLLPGGALWIVPVHAQHRGRLFLPFADDDPKTAEVISKVILLARDEQIQDPQILQQIRR